MAMNSSFGEYITKEYGLLKQILSYLQPCDLWNAKLVCQDWKRTVESLVYKNPVMIVSRGITDDINSSFVDHKPILPALMLQQIPVHSFKCLWRCKECSMPKMLDICPCSQCGPDSTYIFVSSIRSCFLRRNHTPTNYNFCQLFLSLLLPDSEHIQVSVFSAQRNDPIFKMPMTDEVVDKCVGGSQAVKCLLILTRPGSIDTNWLNKLLTQIVYRQGRTFALGGGLIYKIRCKRKPNFSSDKCDLVLIALRGDNLTAHSDILQDYSKPDIEHFMAKFAERVGPLPNESSRVAFLAQCIDRANGPVESVECSAFKTAFPSVPMFGMQAFGEFGMQNDTKDTTKQSAKKKKMDLTFDHTQTSTFVVLTFKNA